MKNDILLGATGDVVAQYDNSGVVQPVYSSAPVDTSVYDNSGVVQPGSSSAPVDTSVTTDTTTNDKLASATPWLLYLGGAIAFYYLILKKK